MCRENSITYYIKLKKLFIILYLISQIFSTKKKRNYQTQKIDCREELLLVMIPEHPKSGVTVSLIT